MRALDLIVKKRTGDQLTESEIRFLVQGYVKEEIPDYQISAFLMAVFFNGMTPEETGYLTREMIASGDTIDLSSVQGPFVDKHSTGGVGDKVSLILAPMVAACGVTVPMMSGRSLGHTGGTLDKLESIPGYTTDLSPERFAAILKEVGYSMTGQSREIVPADRKLYALRDVTGTVESIPLITGSILSKKFAEGAEGLVFDVKTGNGAFMKDRESARRLAESLVATGGSLGKKIVAVLTRMETPLGAKVGNFLEVEESLALLNCPEAVEKTPIDERSNDLLEVTLHLGAWMVRVAGKADSYESAREMCRKALDDGEAWTRMKRNVELQGGNLQKMYRALGSMRAPAVAEITASADGYLKRFDAYLTGMAGVYLGVGRSKAGDPVRADAGIELLTKPGSYVKAGSPIARLWGENDAAVEQAQGVLEQGIEFGPEPPEISDSMIIEEITTL